MAGVATAVAARSSAVATARARVVRARFAREDVGVARRRRSPDLPGATPSRVPRRRARVRVRVRDADLSAKSPSSSLDTEFDVPNADDASDPDAPGKYDSSSLPASFCIIEGGQNQVRDFADMIPSELMNNIESRKQRVFIMLEEVRRLRVQLQLRTRDAEEPPPPPREYESVVPGFPRITENNYNDYYIYWSAVVIGFLIFGGLIAPLAEVKLGMGGTSYLEFIEFVGLPRQLAEIDPIVASFTGGAVGAISAFFAIEIQNFKEQERKLCMYCKGTGYLTCAECSTSASPGRLVDPSSGSKCYCGVCMGTAKVMCTSCLCTGRGMVTEHDPRIDPFD